MELKHKLVSADSHAGFDRNDFIERMFVAHSHDYLLCFSNRGRLYWLKVYEVPAGSRSARGRPIVNMFPLQEGEKITAVVPVKEFDENHFVFMATSKGTVKKTALDEFSRPRPSGLIAVGLDEGDYLVGAALTDGKYDVMLFSSDGKGVRFEEGGVRPMGRQAYGVNAMDLDEGDKLILRGRNYSLDRPLSFAMLVAVVLQGVLGGVTVLYKLPIAVSVTHACLAQVFFCLTVTLAVPVTTA